MPGRYVEAIAVMKDMRWSWEDYQSAPADLLDELSERIHWESYWTVRKREMDGA